MTTAAGHSRRCTDNSVRSGSPVASMACGNVSQWYIMYHKTHAAMTTQLELYRHKCRLQTCADVRSGCGYYQQGTPTNKVLPPAMCCHQQGAATSNVLPPARCYHQQLGATTSMVLPPAIRCYHQHGATTSMHGATTSKVLPPAIRCYHQQGATTSN